jgi:hypothetical protein
MWSMPPLMLFLAAQYTSEMPEGGRGGEEKKGGGGGGVFGIVREDEME